MSRRRLALLVCWTVAIGAPVCDSMFNISGGFTKTQVDDFMRRMKAGSPRCAEPKP